MKNLNEIKINFKKLGLKKTINLIIVHDHTTF